MTSHDVGGEVVARTLLPAEVSKKALFIPEVLARMFQIWHNNGSLWRSRGVALSFESVRIHFPTPGVVMSTGEHPAEFEYDPNYGPGSEGWIEGFEYEHPSKEGSEMDRIFSEEWTRNELTHLGMFRPSSPVEEQIKSAKEQFFNELLEWQQENKITRLVEYARYQFNEGMDTEFVDTTELLEQAEWFRQAYDEILEFIAENLGAKTEDVLRDQGGPDGDAENPAADGGGRLLKQERADGNDACIKRAMFILGGVSFVGAADLDAWSFWKIFQRCADDQPTDDIPGEEKMKSAVRELVKKWQGMPDKEFWDVMAANVEAGLVLDGTKRSYTIADQIVFLTMAKQLCPPMEAFNWDSVRDQVENAKALRAHFETRFKPSDLYRNILDVTYKGKPLPRWIAANQIMAALTTIAVAKRTPKN